MLVVVGSVLCEWTTLHIFSMWKTSLQRDTPAKSVAMQAFEYCPIGVRSTLWESFASVRSDKRGLRMFCSIWEHSNDSSYIPDRFTTVWKAPGGSWNWRSRDGFEAIERTISKLLFRIPRTGETVAKLRPRPGPGGTFDNSPGLQSGETNGTGTQCRRHG